MLNSIMAAKVKNCHQFLDIIIKSLKKISVNKNNSDQLRSPNVTGHQLKAVSTNENQSRNFFHIGGRPEPSSWPTKLVTWGREKIVLIIHQKPLEEIQH